MASRSWVPKAAKALSRLEVTGTRAPMKASAKSRPRPRPPITDFQWDQTVTLACARWDDATLNETLTQPSGPHPWQGGCGPPRIAGFIPLQRTHGHRRTKLRKRFREPRVEAD